jgi:hypothetical protein
MTLGECLVEGTQGSLQLFGDGRVHHREFGKLHETLLLPARNWPGFAEDCVFNSQEHVISTLLYGTTLENEAADYLAVLEIEEAIYQSAAEHRRVEISRKKL